jgi:GNAT acetyltransferase-like protein
MASDEVTAQHLLDQFQTRASRENLIVDCLTANRVVVELLQNSGFSYARALTRMYRGPNDYPGNPDTLCAIVGPEFG